MRTMPARSRWPDITPMARIESSEASEAGVGLAGIRDAAERLVQRFAGGVLERQHAPGVAVRSLRAFARQLRAAHQSDRVLAQRLDPERLGPVVGDVEVAGLARAREPLGLPQRRPAGGAVAGARGNLHVAEGLREQRLVAERLAPEARQLPRGQRERWERMARAPLRRNREAPVLHHELLALRAGRRRPADPFVPVLEPVAGRTPDHQRLPFAVLLDDQPQRVAAGMGFAHVVVFAFELSESALLAVAHRPDCEHVVLILRGMSAPSPRTPRSLGL